MRASYQIHTTAPAECCYLMPACLDLSLGRDVGEKRLAVPNSPGRARRSYPYSSRRLRRRQ